jgi:hypothetical protein
VVRRQGWNRRLEYKLHKRGKTWLGDAQRPPASDDPPDSLEDLFALVQYKRLILFELAQSKRAYRRLFQVILGTIGLVSALVAAAVFADLLGSTVIKVVTAVAAFLSGVATLLMNSYFATAEADKMFDGAAEFHGLREKIDFEAGLDTTPNQAKAALKKFKEEYVRLSQRYDRLFPPGAWTNQPATAKAAPSK